MPLDLKAKICYNVDVKAEKPVLRGQAMIEYILAFCALLVVISVVGHLVVAAKESSARTHRIIASDYP